MTLAIVHSGSMSANVRPVRLEHGTLLVEVDDPAWATQVRFLSDDIPSGQPPMFQGGITDGDRAGPDGNAFDGD